MDIVPDPSDGAAVEAAAVGRPVALRVTGGQAEAIDGVASARPGIIRRVVPPPVSRRSPR